MEAAMRDPNFMIAAAMLTAVLAGITPAAAQTETASSSECPSISVNTEHAPQLNAAISVCTRVLGRNELSPKTRTELLLHRGLAYRNVGDLDKSLADLGAHESNGQPDDARRLRQQGQRKFPKDKRLMLPPTR
jgi:hypothetical protein